jgi:hypothetical protein
MLRREPTDDGQGGSLLQTPLRTAQVVLLHFQFADNHLKAVQLDALKGLPSASPGESEGAQEPEPVSACAEAWPV